jgi:hypothetical protein
MAECVNLLVVEDSENDLRQWVNRVERHNAEEGKRFAIEIAFAKSRFEAESLIQARRFDAAIVDLSLRLEGIGQHHNDDGNEVVRALAAGEMAAVVVYTGQPAEAATYDSDNIKVLIKGDGVDEAFAWLLAQDEIILAIRKAQKIIRQDMALTFHRSIWPRWQQWREDQAGADKVELPLARHLVSHVYTRLLRSEKVHPEEHYYVPPIPESEFSTGDLLTSSSGLVEVVITPRCDIAHAGKAETLQLAACLDISERWKGLRKSASTTSQNDVKKIMQHEGKHVQHFIPEMTLKPGKLQGPWFVRFDRVRSVEMQSEEYKALKDRRLASISTDFLPALVQRLGAFFSRFGAPDLL